MVLCSEKKTVDKACTVNCVGVFPRSRIDCGRVEPTIPKYLGDDRARAETFQVVFGGNMRFLSNNFSPYHPTTQTKNGV